MPRRHEHTAIVHEGRFIRYRSGGSPHLHAEGVRFLYGIRPGGGSVIHDVLFQADRWTPTQAKDWLRSHGFHVDAFEQASS